MNIDLAPNLSDGEYSLTLEDAVAIAPPRPPTPTFTASAAAIAWGAVRSGK